MRSGGKDMANSANFPRDFGRFVAKSHLATEECSVHMHDWLLKICVCTLVNYIIMQQQMQDATPDLVKLVRGGFREAWLHRIDMYMLCISNMIISPIYIGICDIVNFLPCPGATTRHVALCQIRAPVWLYCKGHQIAGVHTGPFGTNFCQTWKVCIWTCQSPAGRLVTY